MHFIKGLFGRNSIGKSDTSEARSRYSSLSNETFLVKLRTPLVPEVLSRGIKMGFSNAEDDLFIYLEELRRPWMAVSSLFNSSSSKKKSSKKPDETIQRLEFLEAVYEGLGKLGRSEVTYAKNFIQLLVFTLDDLTSELLHQYSSKVVKVLYLIQVIVSEDTSPLFLSEDFASIFERFIKVVVETILGCPIDKLRDFQQLLFTVLQTNFSLGELYAAHLQYKPDINRLILRVLENYREVLRNSPLLGQLFSLKAGSLVNAGLLRCSHLNLCLDYKELDITLQVIVQLSRLSNFIFDEVNANFFKNLILEYLVSLLLGQLPTLPEDEESRYVVIHKASKVAKLLLAAVERADIPRYNLALSIKVLIYNTSLSYLSGSPLEGCTSFTKDVSTLARFFLYVSGICIKLIGLEELEYNIVLMLQSLTVSEMLEASRGLPPVVQAYSLELVDRYLEAVINKGLRMEWLVRAGICDVLLNHSLFVMDSQHQEVGHIAVSYTYDILCKIVSVTSSAASCMHSWHFSISMHLSDVQYINSSLTLLVNISNTPQGVSALSDHETFNYLLKMLSEHLFVTKEAVIVMDCVDKIMQMLNFMLRLPDLEIKTELLPTLFGSMMRSPMYFSLACSYLTEAFKNTVLSTSMYEQFIQVLRDQTSPGLTKDMLTSVERVLQTCSRAERDMMQSNLIKKIPAAVIKKINDTKDLGLCTSLLSLIRSQFSSSNRSSQLDVIDMLFKSVKEIIKKRASSDSEFRDLIFNLLMILFETTQLEGSSTTYEVQNPKLIPYIISMLRVCANNEIVESYLHDLREYLSESLYNLAIFNSFQTVGKLLKFMKRSAVKTHALELVELIGSYYIRPSSLKLLLEMLNDSISRAHYQDSEELVDLLLKMSSKKHDRFKLSGSAFANSRTVPRHCFHFKSQDSYIKVSDSGSVFENDCCSFVMWVYPKSPGCIFSLYTANPRPRLTVMLSHNNQICFRYSPASAMPEVDLPLSLDIELNKWSFLALTVFRNQISVGLNAVTVKATDLPANIAADFKTSKDFCLNFGCLKVKNSLMKSSFIGDLSLFYVAPGVKDLPSAEIYSLGFDLIIEPRHLEAVNTGYYEEPTSTRFREMTDKITIKLLAEATSELPRATSLRANRLKNPDFAAFIAPTTRADSLTVKSAKVSVVTGHTLLEAFHALGGLKLLIGLLHKVGGMEEPSVQLVERVVETLKNLFKVKHLLTYHEVVQQHLLEMLDCQLRILAKRKLVSEDVLMNVVECMRGAWLYGAPVNVKTVGESQTMQAVLQTHSSFVLLTDYSVWRSLDQEFYYSRLTEAVSHMQMMMNVPEEPSKLSDLQTYYLNYFLSLARDQPQTLVRLKQLTGFKAKMKLRQKLFIILQLAESEVRETQSVDALQLLLEIAADFDIEEYQELAVKKFDFMQKNVALTMSFIVNQCEDPVKRSDIMKCSADILIKLLSLKAKTTVQKSDERWVGDLKEMVFTEARYLRKADMLPLLFKYFKRCKDIEVKFDFKATLCLLHCHCRVLEVTTNNELLILSEIISEQFRQLSDFGESYEALYNLSLAYLQSEEERLGNYEYLSRLLEHIVTFSQYPNEFQVTFIMYYAEDISRIARLPLNLSLIEQLYSLLLSANQVHNNDPKIPSLRKWELLQDVRVDCPLQFKRREGGFVRIFLGVLLKSVVHSDEGLKSIQLLRLYLKLGTEQHRLAFSSIETLGALPSLVDFNKSQSDPNLFSYEVHLLGYVFGELAEAIRLIPHLRLQAAFELMIECFLTRDRNLLNFASFYESRQQQPYCIFMQRNYKWIAALCCRHMHSGREECEVSYETEDFDSLEREKSHLEMLEDTLNNCRKQRAYDSLIELMQTQHSTLRKVIDFALAFTSAKVRLVEEHLESQEYSFKVDNYASVKLSTKTENKPESHVVRSIRHAYNLRRLGIVKHRSLIKALQQPLEVFQNPITGEFWKLAQISDAQGRRQRFVPFCKGSNYLDKVNKKYLQGSEQTTEIDINSIISSFSSTPESVSTAFEGTIEPDTKVVAEVERARHSRYRSVMECERISVSSSVYGVLEVSPTLVIFRSKNRPRPTGTYYEVSTQNYCHRQHTSLKVWKLSEIEEILPKTFMHVLCALEVYCKDGRSYLFNLFQTEILLNLRDMMVSCPEFAGVYTDNGREGILQWTKRWKQREVSNLEYLVMLNRYSSRSYNNLNQYPVFPWVLANYVKERPLFTEDDYRDLRKPVGALNEAKRADSQARYASFESEQGMEPYHYGSHYSLGGCVMHFLLRVEPYSAQAIIFQDDHFDVADRLFFSIKTAWEGSFAALGDFKELIPEMFFLPEMLLNLHHYNLGIRQTGTCVDNVQLPNWAFAGDERMDAYRFVFFHRQALESGVVSGRLDKWINLIFGSKQEDKSALNVFYPITYAHHFTQLLASADIPRASLLAQVAHFGQTPAKLFERDHDKRKAAASDIKDRHLFSEFDPSSISEAKVNYKDERRVSRGKSRLAMAPVVVSILLRRELSCVIYDNEGRYHAHFFDVNRPDALKLLETYTSRDSCELDLVKISLPLDAVNSEWFGFSETRVLISGRHPDNSFRFSLVMTKPYRVLPRLQVTHHTDIVTCLELAEDSLLITAALDGSLALWDVDLRASDLTCRLRMTLRGHNCAITQVVVSPALQLLASLSTVTST
jgi:hypothetical protein